MDNGPCIPDCPYTYICKIYIYNLHMYNIILYTISYLYIYVIYIYIYTYILNRAFKHIGFEAT